MYSEDEITIPNLKRLQEVEGWQEFYDHTEPFEPKNWLYDARRFCHKVYAMLDAFESEHRYVVWLDIDIEFKKRLTKQFFKALLDDSAVAYLGRGNTYTETGFLAFDTKHPDFEEFKTRLRYIYDQRFLFSMEFFVDCVAIDAAMRGLDCRNLTPEANGMIDVFSESPLAEYMTHNKGQGHDKYREAS